MLHDIIYLVVGLVLLIAGANYVTDGAVAVARKFRVPTLIIGLTVVALGSSMPDIVVCVESAIEGKTAIAVGEVVGANIFDLLLVVGLMALIRPWAVSRIMRGQDLPLLFTASSALWIAGDTILFDGISHNIIDRTSGLMLIVIFIFYMWFMLQASKSQPALSVAGSPDNASSEDEVSSGLSVKVTATDTAVNHGTAIARKLRAEEKLLSARYGALLERQWFAWIMIIGGLGALVVGGNWVVDGAGGLALKAGMSQGMVALTVVAIGNSLPDLVTSLTATLKGESGIALGNIVGACIINSLLAIGLSATITPLGADTIGFVDFVTLAGASLLLWVLPLLKRSHRLGHPEGMILILLYVCYMTYTIIRG